MDTEIRPFWIYHRISSFVIIAFISLPISLAAPLVPSNMPLANIDRALSNVALTISAEFPTADTSSYGTTGSGVNPSTTSYYPTITYLGYFDPAKCYTYSASDTYFSPAPCASGVTPKGNFLNWASMSVLDQYRQVMTGGLRFIDTATTTVLQRSFMDSLSGAGESTVNPANINSPNRVATTADAGNLGVMAGTAQSGQYIYKISGMGDKMLVQSGSPISLGLSSEVQRAMQDCSTLSTTINSATTMCYHIRVKVCDPSPGLGLEANCNKYGNNYKPEGLMQQYSQNMRFAAFGYLVDDSMTQSQQGGVLRARMKSIGPTFADPVNISKVNSNMEWDPNTGVFITNPDSADAAASSILAGTTIGNSGVINYVNKLGQSADPATGYAYKYYDPMAELYYDSLRYLRGLPVNPLAMTNAVPTYPQGFDSFPAINYQGTGTSDDPVISACQQSFIIAIGDKNNQQCDTRVPGGTTYSCTAGALPAGDSVNFATPADTVLGLFGPGSSPANSVDTPAYGAFGNKYMAGMAYWAHTNDIRPLLAAQRPAGDMQTVTTFMIDVLEGHNYDGTAKTQLWMAAKYGGFDLSLTDQTSAASRTNPNTYKNGSAVSPWNKNGDGVPDNWYQGNNPTALKTGLSNVFQTIATATSLGDGAAPATSGTSPTTASKVYYASYKLLNGGIGALKACPSNSTINACGASPDWDAAVWLDPTSANYLGYTARQIITRSNGNGVAFSYGNLTAGEKALLDKSPITGATDNLGTLRANYLRGDSSNEISKTGGSFRTRATTKLGDIVSSAAVYVGPPNALYSGPNFAGYSNFIKNNSSRNPTLYVGANDGMLHAFDAASGKEVFAYVPNYFLTADPVTTSARVNSLTMPTYQHQFFVDATPMIGDVMANGSWKTLLVGGYGAGGKGFYALDVTDPNKFSTAMNAESQASSLSMWEISDADDADIGFTFNQPVTSPISDQALQYALVPTASGGSQWAIIVGNGFGSTNGKAVLYFLSPYDGSQLFKVVVESTLGDNGLATPFPASTTGNGVIDTVWAGDLKGNMWRVRWDAQAKKWTSSAAFSGSPAKPITSAPAATPHPFVAGAWAVVFGSGKYIERSDYNTTTQQSLYGIVDNFSNTQITVADLVQQTIIPNPPSTPGLTPAGDFWRTTSSNSVNFNTNKGWYFNMPAANGERSIANPKLPADTGIALMSSFTPASSCMSATGYVNVFNAFTGQAVPNTPTWGAIGMGIPYFGTVVSSAGKAIIKVGGVRYGSSVACQNCVAAISGIELTKTFVKGTRASWRQIR